MTSLIKKESSGAVAEGMSRFEGDVNLLRSILALMERSTAETADLSFDLSETPDPLTASGFVVAENGIFRIKSALHRDLLRRYFTNEHVGRIYFAAGRWEQALDYFRRDLERDPSGARAAAFCSPRRTLLTRLQHLPAAFSAMERGLHAAYPEAQSQIFLVREQELERIETNGQHIRVIESIPLAARARAEILPYITRIRMGSIGRGASGQPFWCPCGLLRSGGARTCCAQAFHSGQRPTGTTRNTSPPLSAISGISGAGTSFTPFL